MEGCSCECVYMHECGGHTCPYVYVFVCMYVGGVYMPMCVHACVCRGCTCPGCMLVYIVGGVHAHICACLCMCMWRGCTCLCVHDCVCVCVDVYIPMFMHVCLLWGYTCQCMWGVYVPCVHACVCYEGCTYPCVCMLVYVQGWVRWLRGWLYGVDSLLLYVSSWFGAWVTRLVLKVPFSAWLFHDSKLDVILFQMIIS